MAVAVKSSVYITVQLLERASVGNVTVYFTRVTFNCVVSSLERVSKLVKLDKVYSILVDVDGTAVFVVFGTQVNPYESLTALFSVHSNSVVERFVVQPLLTSADLEVVAVVFLLVFLLGNVDGVANIRVEVVEVSHQPVELDVLDGNSWVVQFVVGVRGQVGLVLLEEQDDLLVDQVESGVAQRGFELLESRWVQLVGRLGLVSVAEETTGVGLVGTVEVGIGRVSVGLYEVAQDFEALLRVGVDVDLLPSRLK